MWHKTLKEGHHLQSIGVDGKIILMDLEEIW
jgi:hypothetical protein